MTADMLVRLEGVTFSYGSGTAVLDGLDLELRPRERVALLGPNGAGKTTLMHVMVGLLRPESGRVVAFGRAREREADFHEVRRRIGLLFQDPDDQLFCPTVIEDVAFGPVNTGLAGPEAFAAARNTLAELELSHLADRVTYRLSGGEKRLVSLATVLALRPELLLLDEPTANLDAHARGHLEEVLADRAEAILLATHDLDAVAMLTTRIILLDQGRIVADGPTEAVLSDAPLLARHGVGA